MFFELILILFFLSVFSIFKNLFLNFFIDFSTTISGFKSKCLMRFTTENNKSPISSSTFSTLFLICNDFFTSINLQLFLMGLNNFSNQN